jgi:hypothetical protein
MNLARRGTTAPRKRRKAATKAARAAHALVELVPTTTTAGPGHGRYALVVGGARVEFGDDASVATLGRVLQVLRSC